MMGEKYSKQMASTVMAHDDNLRLIRGPSTPHLPVTLEIVVSVIWP